MMRKDNDKTMKISGATFPFLILSSSFQGFSLHLMLSNKDSNERRRYRKI